MNHLSWWHNTLYSLRWFLYLGTHCQRHLKWNLNSQAPLLDFPYIIKWRDLFFINLQFLNVVYQFWFQFAALAKSYTIIAVAVIIAHIFIPCTQLVGKKKYNRMNTPKSEADLRPSIWKWLWMTQLHSCGRWSIGGYCDPFLAAFYFCVSSSPKIWGKII